MGGSYIRESLLQLCMQGGTGCVKYLVRRPLASGCRLGGEGGLSCRKSVAMYYNDHAPPHFHANYGDHEAAIAIETGEVIAGSLPPRILGLVDEWRRFHKSELHADWRLARARKALKRIDPLE